MARPTGVTMELKKTQKPKKSSLKVVKPVGRR